MGEGVCAIHADRSAVGKCSLCKKTFCLDCLDVETGETLCPNCLKVKKAYSTGDPAPPAPSPAPAASAPPSPTVPPPAPAPKPEPVTPPSPAPPPAAPKPASSPLDFSGKGLDDDPLGLFSGPSAAPPKPAIPAPTPPKPSPVPATPPKVGTPSPPKPAPVMPPPASTPDPLDLLGGSSEPSKPFGGIPEASLPPMSYPLGSLSGVPETSKGRKIYANVKIWAKYLIRKAYESFDPLAKKLHVPTFVVVASFPLLGVGAILGLAFLLRPSPVKLIESLPALHVMRMRPSQVGELDVTTLAELQQRVRGMGFSSLAQVSLPEIPSTNYLDVWVKGEAGTYAEIIKFPGQVIPQLSFVTVFNNGVWCSTNAWKGTDQRLAYLVSRFHPGEAPDKLYVKHIQNVEKLKKDEGWQVQYMGEGRYFAALSDHLRWFFVERKLQPYKAHFELWH